MKKLLVIFTIWIAVLVYLKPPVTAYGAEVAQGAANLTINETGTPDNRTELLGDYLKSNNSPLAGEAKRLVSEADRLGLDWKLVAAISGVESTFGKFTPSNSYNAWGWGIFTGAQDGVHFADWNDGVTKVSEGLRYNYIDKGYTTVDQIGRVYAASPAWSWKVNFFLAQIADFKPKDPQLLEVAI